MDIYGGVPSLVLRYANVVLNIICPFGFHFRHSGTYNLQTLETNDLRQLWNFTCLYPEIGLVHTFATLY